MGSSTSGLPAAAVWLRAGWNAGIRAKGMNIVRNTRKPRDLRVYAAPAGVDSDLTEEAGGDIFARASHGPAARVERWRSTGARAADAAGGGRTAATGAHLYGS